LKSKFIFNIFTKFSISSHELRLVVSLRSQENFHLFEIKKKLIYVSQLNNIKNIVKIEKKMKDRKSDIRTQM